MVETILSVKMKIKIELVIIVTEENLNVTLYCTGENKINKHSWEWSEKGNH